MRIYLEDLAALAASNLAVPEPPCHPEHFLEGLEVLVDLVVLVSLGNLASPEVLVSLVGLVCQEGLVGLVRLVGLEDLVVLRPRFLIHSDLVGR